MSARIDMLWPDPGDDLGDDALVNVWTPSGDDWLRMNFVASLDGAATREGRSGGLGGDADRRMFALLRRPADAVLVGAGTVRAEGYGGVLVDAATIAWREANGLAPHPALVLISAHLDLDPRSPVFADAPVRPIVATVAAAPVDRRAALAEVADLVDAGERDLDPSALRSALAARGLRRIHSEGGPTLFGAFLAADAVDELCLTVAPTLEGGPARRITRSPHPTPTGMRLRGVLRGGDELLLRYSRVS
jgi:riboflavin biosynthesis pyrimidine reductase